MRKVAQKCRILCSSLLARLVAEDGEKTEEFVCTTTPLKNIKAKENEGFIAFLRRTSGFRRGSLKNAYDLKKLALGGDIFLKPLSHPAEKDF